MGCTCHIGTSPVLSNLTRGFRLNAQLSYFVDVLLNSSLWFFHGASHFQEGFIFTDIGVVVAVNSGIYSIEIYVQAEMIIPLAPRLKGSGSETNDKRGHKRYRLRWYIAEGA